VFRPGRGTDGLGVRLPADGRLPRAGARHGRSGPVDRAARPRHLPTGHDGAAAGSESEVVALELCRLAAVIAGDASERR